MSRLIQRLERPALAQPAPGTYCRAQLRTRASCLFVSAFPKSGSTFLVEALVQSSGYPRYYLGQDFRSEQDLYFPRLVDAWAMPVASHQHTHATEPNLELMHRFRICPVILTRNLADCLVNLKDHLCRESLLTPTFNAPPGFPDWPPERQFDALVDLAAPWYLDFYSGWRRAEARGLELLWIDCPGLIIDPGACIGQIMGFHGLPLNAEKLRAGVERTQSRGESTRRNVGVGVGGRGRQALNAAQRARLDVLTGYFPGIDFSAVGAPFSDSMPCPPVSGR